MQAGYPKSDDLNGFQQEGFGRLPMTVSPKAGMRWSTASAYLRPAMTRPNFQVISSTMTDKILFNGTNAKGIKISNFKNPSETAEIYGNEVILCSGAINSPQLLQISGVGNAEHLKSVGVEPIVNLPGVGDNLQDHLEVYVQQECLKPVTLYSSPEFKIVVKYDCSSKIKCSSTINALIKNRNFRQNSKLSPKNIDFS